MKIRILDTAVAAKIAAGEVVERPASVVKELLENSLDAGAMQVIVEVQYGGMELIRVTDDGEGIPVLELEVAFERHATSKIVQDTDLDRVTSLGFRGEALPSIAAVSRMVLTSRARGSQQGAFLRLRGGEMERKGAVGCPEGTTVTVQDLFYNVPARRKFLRSQAAEGGRVHALVTQLALAFPHVRFRLLANGKERFVSPGNGNFRDVLTRIYGTEVADALLEVDEVDSEGRSVRGCVSAPSRSRANRSGINFFVNRRWVQSRLLSQAVEQSYLGLLMERRYPLVSLHLALSPEEVDVNVHPAKREVRFHHEGSVFTLVQRGVRQVLVAMSPVPLVQPDSPGTRPPGLHIESLTLRPAAAVAGDGARGQAAAEEPPLLRETLPALRVLGQASNTYIVAEGPEGVYLIDQHAAHERVLFEKVRCEWQERRVEVQGLLQPQAVELLPAQMQALEWWRELLEGHGISGEVFGERTFLLRGVPGGLRNTGPEGILIEALELLAQARDPAQAQDSLASSIACHSAVRAGDALSQQEMAAVVRQLEATDSPHTCPHGRPTMLHLSASNLEREFGRR